LKPGWGWSAEPPNYSAEISIDDPSDPDSATGGRIGWSSDGDAAFISNQGDVYGIEGTHKTPSAAVRALNKQHLPNARIINKFKNSEVQPLAQQIQDAGGYDSWKEQNQ
jgi:hypothetical protein